MYLATFAGRTCCSWKHLVWQPWAPLKFKFFVWLVCYRCWTLDKFAKQGLPDRGKVFLVFRWDVTIVYGGVDSDDPTTNVWGRRVLAIAKPTPRGRWPHRSTINLITRVWFLHANKEQARNWNCNLDIANIRGKLYWWKWSSVTSWSVCRTQTKDAELQLWQTCNLNKT